MFETTKGTVCLFENDDQLFQQYHLVAKEGNEPFNPIVELVISKRHCIKIEETVEPEVILILLLESRSIFQFPLFSGSKEEGGSRR